MDRESELDAFKTMNLSVIAAAHGYEIDRKKSTRHSVLMTNGADKIIVSQNGNHFVYCSVLDPSSNGTVIDLVQNVIEPGCSLGRVRQLLRPFLSGGYLNEVQLKYRGSYAAEIKPSATDLIGVAARYAQFDAIDQPHKYLCDVRGIPFEMLQHRRLHGRVVHCPRRGSIAFGHYGCPNATESKERCLTGYEIKGPAVNMFSKGGRKGLWMSVGFKTDNVLAIGESGLDAVSYLAARGPDRIRVASLAGKMNPLQPALIVSAIERMGQGSQIIAAFDNDAAGDELTQRLAELVSSVDRDDLEFKEDRPGQRGADWNQVIVEQAVAAGRVRDSQIVFGR